MNAMTVREIVGFQKQMIGSQCTAIAMFDDEGYYGIYDLIDQDFPRDRDLSMDGMRNSHRLPNAARFRLLDSAVGHSPVRALCRSRRLHVRIGRLFALRWLVADRWETNCRKVVDGYRSLALGFVAIARVGLAHLRH
jgi:hypothetical protein